MNLQRQINDLPPPVRVFSPVPYLHFSPEGDIDEPKQSFWR